MFCHKEGKGLWQAARCTKASLPSCQTVIYLKHSVDKGNQLVGTNDNPIQIDEARFVGQQKYNQGRMLNGNTDPLFKDCDAKR